jgi:methyl coenzyme M reductase system subunit A2
MMLLADEPTGTLDPKTAQVVHQNLKKLSKELGITVLITSHFPEVIEEMATRALLLENGRIKMLGRPGDVIKAFTGGIEAVERKEVQTGGSVIKVEGLFKKYFSVDRGVINAVNGVTFDIREGEIFGIVGTSGAGKTSLTNILTGNLEPTSGMVEMKVGDDWINLCEPGYYARGRAKPYIGLLHQEYDLYPHRTVIENMTDSIGLEFPAELAEDTVPPPQTCGRESKSWLQPCQKSHEQKEPANHDGETQQTQNVFLRIFQRFRQFHFFLFAWALIS